MLEASTFLLDTNSKLTLGACRQCGPGAFERDAIVSHADCTLCCWLAFTRYSFTLRLLCMIQPFYHPPAHLHCPPW